MREIQGVRQDNPSLKRRWYQDDFFDLYTWHSTAGALVSFQLCYDVHGRERALSWHRQRGFSHNRIDSGEAANEYPMTPILVAEARFPHRLVRQRFNRHGATLDAPTRTIILDKMREYGRLVARGVISLPRIKRRTPPTSNAA